jgi:hypothetical protein
MKVEWTKREVGLIGVDRLPSAAEAEDVGAAGRSRPRRAGSAVAKLLSWRYVRHGG